MGSLQDQYGLYLNQHSRGRRRVFCTFISDVFLTLFYLNFDRANGHECGYDKSPLSSVSISRLVEITLRVRASYNNVILALQLW